ncbi:hypothetical protein [Streptomyces atratus]|uniref:Uncharacterized protein n=1 Tax=Streptomyces atratus TaxID=1893 RepID=A0A2Z5J6Y1_STRAR|nr:hypothetical protein [Streptomyces atratus]AXE76020.1 hypothetical protein C5746_02485 [Streptomyces atratus]
MGMHYYRYADGSVSEREYSGDGEPDVPEGASEITQQEYEEAKAALDAEQAEHVAAIDAEAQERARQDYEALIAAGIPPETAARMSGYNPPHPNVGSAQKKGT